MDNIKNIIAKLDEYGVDALLLTADSSCHYATGVGLSEGTAFITKQGCTYMTDSRYIEAAQRDIQCAKVLMTDSRNSPNSYIAGIIAQQGIEKVGFEEDRLTYAAYNKTKEALGVELVEASGLLVSLRRSKNADEVEKMRAAQALTDEVFAEILGVIKEGMTEKELAAEIIYRFYKKGAEGLSFDPIVVAGPNSSLPHGVPTDRKLQKGDFITMDIGCVLGGYCSDMTRTVALGYADDEMKKVYETVLAAQKAGISAAKAGMTGHDIDKAARDVIAAAGYGEYFGHSFGHSLGLEVHEAPNASPINKEPMPVGAVISAEPGIYLPGRFGVRIEDVIILGENGCEDITKSPKELIIV